MLMVMDSQQSLPPTQTPAPGNYDFIMNPSQPPKKTRLGGGSMLQRIALVGGGLVVLMIAVMIFGAVFSGGNGQSQTLISLAAEQQEIVRVSDLGLKTARGNTVRQFALVTKLNMLTDQATLLDRIAKNGTKYKPEQLQTKRNTATDTKLTGTTVGDEYDAALNVVLKERLTAYKQNLKNAYGVTSGTNTKQVLSDLYDHADALLK
jgi:hypothetical protein